MAAAHVTVNSFHVDRTRGEVTLVERANITSAANGDWYDSAHIATIQGAHLTPNFVTAAADCWGVTFATNRATLALVNTVADDFSLTIWGV